MNDENQLRSDLMVTLADAVKCLEGGGFEYMITGSVALLFHGEARLTRDIDIIVDVRPARAGKLVEALSARFEVQPEMIEDEVSRRGMANVFHSDTFFKVDLIIRVDDALTTKQFERREQATTGDLQLWLISVEDLILAKLRWAKDSHSDYQLRDVRALIQTNPNLDSRYLDPWLSSLQLRELWDEVNDE